ncbi:MAG: hypothetical protein ABIW38_03075, partial [Ferruginibacter sp.]
MAAKVRTQAIPEVRVGVFYQLSLQLIIFKRFMPALDFQLLASDTQSRARAGIITTDHGEIPTPVFMPVGTVGSVKAVTQQQLLA